MKYRTGWRPSAPDLRDYTMAHPGVNDLLQMTNIPATLKAPAPAMPPRADLRSSCSPVKDQGDLGACTAFATVGALEYCERQAFGKFLSASELFLYGRSLYLQGFHDDLGADIRTAVGALTAFGAPPDRFLSYDPKKFLAAPSPEVFALAQNFQALTYYRLDTPGQTPPALLSLIKTKLAAKLPVIFGFSCYASIDGNLVTKTGEVPFPQKGERVEGGHAILGVGYDDNKVIGKSTGALLFKNSWGTSWGMLGYGWLPYDYVLQGQAEDFWVLVKAEWLDTGQFGF